MSAQTGVRWTQEGESTLRRDKGRKNFKKEEGENNGLDKRETRMIFSTASCLERGQTEVAENKKIKAKQERIGSRQNPKKRNSDLQIKLKEALGAQMWKYRLES